MAKKILITQGHPDPAGGHLCHALADAYAEGASLAGADVRRIEVAQLEFPLLQSQAQWESGEAGAPDSIKLAIPDMKWADHMLIIYPLWLGTMPALLKGFLEQALRSGVGMDTSGKGFPKPLFKGKSARVAVTMGMPALAYRWFYGAHSLKSLERNILGFVGVKPIRESLFGLVDVGDKEAKQKRIDGFKETGRKDAR